jgi:hypothetical protein
MTLAVKLDVLYQICYKVFASTIPNGGDGSFELYKYELDPPNLRLKAADPYHVSVFVVAFSGP